MLSPPWIPPVPVTPYSKCYCEENVYLLLEALQTMTNLDTYAVFISNENKTIAVWEQKAAMELGRPVIWDYHVIAVVIRKGVNGELGEPLAWVYDFDTLLGMPCPFEEYIERSFRTGFVRANIIPYEFRCKFRIVPSSTYLDHFASDRSHMVITSYAETPQYISPPPAYPPLIGRLSLASGIRNNLMETFVSMSVGTEKTKMGGIFPDEEFWSLEWELS